MGTQKQGKGSKQTNAAAASESKIAKLQGELDERETDVAVLAAIAEEAGLDPATDTVADFVSSRIGSRTVKAITAVATAPVAGVMSVYAPTAAKVATGLGVASALVSIAVSEEKHPVLSAVLNGITSLGSNCGAIITRDAISHGGAI